jgi:hypothetical protein
LNFGTHPIVNHRGTGKLDSAYRNLSESVVRPNFARVVSKLDSLPCLIGERYLGQRVLWWFNCSGISDPKYICIAMNRYGRTGEIAVTTHEYLVLLLVKDGCTKLSSKSPLKLRLALGYINI